MNPDAFLAKRHDVEVERDVPYGRGRVGVSSTPSWRTLALDVYRPRTGGDVPAGGRPGLLLAFGGAFHRGSKEADEYEGATQRNTPVAAYCRQFARRGYVAFSIDYRLVQEDPDPGTTRVVQDPAAVPTSRVDAVREMLGLPPATARTVWAGIEAASDDMAAAIAFVREQAARWSLDPRRLAIGGFSAGARTALNAAYGERAPVAAVVALSGFMAEADLRHWVRPGGGPPVLLVTAEHDLDYVAQHAEGMRRHFESAGVSHEAWRVPGADHFYPAHAPAVRVPAGSAGAEDPATVESAMADFLYRSLDLAALAGDAWKAVP